jgi:hypothetical protein
VPNLSYSTLHFLLQKLLLLGVTGARRSKVAEGASSSKLASLGVSGAKEMIVVELGSLLEDDGDPSLLPKRTFIWEINKADKRIIVVFIVFIVVSFFEFDEAKIVRGIIIE